MTLRTRLAAVVVGTVALLVGFLLAASYFRSAPSEPDAPALRVYTGSADPDAERPMPLLDCEIEGYPCSWDEAAEGVLDRSVDIAIRALDAYRSDGARAAADWLRDQPGVVRIEFGNDVAGFRLEGGRYMWVGRPDGWPAEARDTQSTQAGTSDSTHTLIERLVHAAFPTVHGQIAGRDRNMDTKVNQHDFRRMVVVQKRAGYAADAFEQLRGLFDASPFYAGRVDERRGGLTYVRGGDMVGTPGWKDFLGWEQYDVIHVDSVGISTCWTVPGNGDTSTPPAPLGEGCRLRGIYSGDSFEGPRSGNPPLSAYKRALDALNVALDFLVVPTNSGTGDADLAAYGVLALVTPDLLSLTYWPEASGLPAGSMDNKLVYFGVDHADDGTPWLYERIFAQRRGPSTLVMWRGETNAAERLEAVIALYGDLLDGYAVDETEILSGPGNAWSRGQQVRIREIVTLVDETGAPLEDGMLLPFEGTPDDSEHDAVSLTARIDGLLPELIGTAHYGGGPTATLEIDGQPVGEVAVTRWREDGAGVRFDRLPLGFDLQAGTSHDVDVVLRIRRQHETSESRYSVALQVFNPDCWWQAEQTGAVFRRYTGSIVSPSRWPGSAGPIIYLIHPRSRPAPGAVELYFDGPLRVGELTTGPQGLPSISVHVPELVNARATNGSISLTVAEPDRIEGSFEVEAGRLDTGPVHLSGRFTWTTGCPTGARD